MKIIRLRKILGGGGGGDGLPSFAYKRGVGLSGLACGLTSTHETINSDPVLLSLQVYASFCSSSGSEFFASHGILCAPCGHPCHSHCRPCYHLWHWHSCYHRCWRYSIDLVFIHAFKRR